MDTVEEAREWLENDANALYRVQCWLAWRCGPDLFVRFLSDDAEARRFLTRNLVFLRALFDLPEYQQKEPE